MLKMITNAITKFIGGVRKALGFKQRVEETVERVIDIVELTDEPAKLLNHFIPSLKTKVLISIVIILSVMYVIGLIASITISHAVPILGGLMLIIVGLITGTRREENYYDNIQEERI